MCEILRLCSCFQTNLTLHLGILYLCSCSCIFGYCICVFVFAPLSVILVYLYLWILYLCTIWMPGTDLSADSTDSRSKVDSESQRAMFQQSALELKCLGDYGRPVVSKLSVQSYTWAWAFMKDLWHYIYSIVSYFMWGRRLIVCKAFVCSCLRISVSSLYKDPSEVWAPLPTKHPRLLQPGSNAPPQEYIPQ